MRKKEYCPYCANGLTEKFTDGRQRLFCEHCDEPVYENPIPSTCVLVTDEQNRLLLVKRNIEPKKGFWCLPGGFMELGETPEECALRELREETGLTDRLTGCSGCVQLRGRCTTLFF